MIKRIQMIGIGALVAGLSLPLPPAVARAQDSVFVTTTGDVGIGTSTPAVRLDVQANAPSAATARLRNSNANGFPGIEYLDESSAVSLFFGLDNAANTTRLNSINNHPIAILTNSTERVRISSTGNVGIGTSSPGAKLHLFDSADVFTVLTMENTSSGVNGVSSLHAHSNSAAAFFQAQGSGRALFRWGQALASWTEVVGVSGNGLAVGTLADKPLILGTNSADRLHIKATGDIGIGTTTPASKLHVNGGDIRVSGGSFIDDGVTLFAPDYVFEPDYELMPLDQLAAFVRAEKHLPNVPKAAEIRASGLNLSQFQMRLLEKIEELTLYALAQEERLAAQQATLAELTAKVEKLEEK